MKVFRFSLSLIAIFVFFPFFRNCSASIEQSLNLASNAFDKLCTSTISLYNALQTDKPAINKISFRHITACQNFTVPLDQAQQLQKHKLFKRTKKTVILATGWLNTINKSDGIAEMSEAFFCRNDVNFVVVDMASYMDTMYKWAAINTEEIGKYIAIGLTKLIKITPLKNIHLIGHSLGAHIMGSAGRTFTKMTNGLLIPRITGLDPAKPCFSDTDHLGSLRKSDARFVDIIHTNCGILGIREPIGNIDFYPGGTGFLQPGCLAIDCSHSRALDYFIESIYPKNAQTFPTYKCQTLEKIESKKCSKSPSKYFMGYSVSNGIDMGIFYVDVNKKSPFGKNGKNNLTNCKKNC